jgi:hypothetical protein
VLLLGARFDVSHRSPCGPSITSRARLDPNDPSKETQKR